MGAASKPAAGSGSSCSTFTSGCRLPLGAAAATARGSVAMLQLLTGGAAADCRPAGAASAGTSSAGRGTAGGAPCAAQSTAIGSAAGICACPAGSAAVTSGSCCSPSGSAAGTGKAREGSTTAAGTAARGCCPASCSAAKAMAAGALCSSGAGSGGSCAAGACKLPLDSCGAASCAGGASRWPAAGNCSVNSAAGMPAGCRAAVAPRTGASTGGCSLRASMPIAGAAVGPSAGETPSSGGATGGGSDRPSMLSAGGTAGPMAGEAPAEAACFCPGRPNPQALSTCCCCEVKPSRLPDTLPEPKEKGLKPPGAVAEPARGLVVSSGSASGNGPACVGGGRRLLGFALMRRPGISSCGAERLPTGTGGGFQAGWAARLKAV